MAALKIKIESEKAEYRLIDQAKDFVDDATRSAIIAALREVNGNATAFTITGAQMVIKAVATAERHLAQWNVVESDRNGAIATLRPSGPYANSYGNAAISTEITIKRAAGVWALVAVDRVSVYPRNPEKFKVTITDKATRNLIKRSLAAFGRDRMPAEEEAAIAA